MDNTYRAAYTRSVQLKDKGRDEVEQKILDLIEEEGGVHFPSLPRQLDTPKFLTRAAVWSLVINQKVIETSHDYLEKES